MIFNDGENAAELLISHATAFSTSHCFIMSTVATERLDYLTIPPPAKLHTATVIWIHVSSLIIPNLPRLSLTFTHLMQGLGDTGRGMASFVRDLSRYHTCNHIKWILPHALVIAIFTVDMILRNELRRKTH